MTLRLRIKQLREQRGMTQEQLAKLCGTQQPQIAKLENGERRITSEWMQILARALNVRPAELFEIAVAELEDDITPGNANDFKVPIAALTKRGLAVYVVETDNVARAGYPRGSVIVIDKGATREALQPGDVVALTAERPDGTLATILRQYLPPGLLCTNRESSNSTMEWDGGTISLELIGAAPR